MEDEEDPDIPVVANQVFVEDFKDEQQDSDQEWTPDDPDYNPMDNDDDNFFEFQESKRRISKVEKPTAISDSNLTASNFSRLVTYYETIYYLFNLTN